MTEMRLRGVPLGIVAVMAVVSAQGSACGGASEEEAAATTAPSASSTGMGGMTSGPGSGGMGGMTGSGGMGTGGQVMASMNAAAQDVVLPIDATPDIDGKTIYFTAADPVQGTGVYKVAAAGGTSSVVSVDAQFAAPLGISIATKGGTLYVADPGAATGMGELEDRGQIFSLATTGGTPTPVSGAGGRRPRNLDVVDENGADQIYFSGIDAGGVPSVLKMAASGGMANVVATDTPLADPSGVAVAKNGDVYVADTLTVTSLGARVLRLTGGKATPIASNLAIGYPVGVALNQANTTLYVSALDPVKNTDVVIVIDLATMNQTMFTGAGGTDISKFEESAGLHRAHDVDTFAWADRTAGANGTVFTISF